MTSEYTPIAWPEVRAGDVLMHDNGDRLTVEHSGEMFVGDLSGRNLMPVSWEVLGFAPYRKRPDLSQVPTEPGAYHDKDGMLVVRQSDEKAGGSYVWCVPESTEESAVGAWYKDEDIALRAPFTCLVPMPTRMELATLIEHSADITVTTADQITDAVMTLLTGGEDENGV